MHWTHITMLCKRNYKKTDKRGFWPSKYFLFRTALDITKRILEFSKIKGRKNFRYVFFLDRLIRYIIKYLWFMMYRLGYLRPKNNFCKYRFDKVIYCACMQIHGLALFPSWHKEGYYFKTIIVLFFTTTQDCTFASDIRINNTSI